MSNILLLLTLILSITQPAQDNLIPNPNFDRTSSIGCPQGWSGWGNCEIKAYPWYCATGTPDGWGACDSIWRINPMPINQNGDFSPEQNALGLFSYLPTTNDPPEIAGTPLISPLMVGDSFKCVLTLKLSIQSAIVAGFDLIIGDTLEVRPQPNTLWQSHVIYGLATQSIDSLFIGGFSGYSATKSGLLQSSYVLISHVGLFRL